MGTNILFFVTSIRFVITSRIFRLFHFLKKCIFASYINYASGVSDLIAVQKNDEKNKGGNSAYDINTVSIRKRFANFVSAK